MMPLVVATLQAQLQALFANPPDTHAQCAQGWADAMQAYAGPIVPPSTTVSAACASLSSALAGAFAAPPSAAVMETAFLAFAATLGSGMAGAGFAAVPPVAPIGFAPQFATNPPDHATAATGIATIIDTWMHLGIATLIAPPNTAQPWA